MQQNFLVISLADQQIAQEQILEILPMVTEVNAVSEELNKHRTFEVILISSSAQEDVYGEKKATRFVFVVMPEVMGRALAARIVT